MHLSGATSDWGYPHLEIARAHRDAGDMAALVGWDDARVKKRVAAIGAASEKVGAQYPRVFDELRSGARNETTIDGIKLTLASVECGPKIGFAGRCAVKLTLVNESGRAIRWSGYRGPFAYVATKKSGPVGVSPVERDLVMKDIASGRRRTSRW